MCYFIHSLIYLTKYALTVCWVLVKVGETVPFKLLLLSESRDCWPGPNMFHSQHKR